MDKIVRKLNSTGLNLKEIALFLTWCKSNKYTNKSLQMDILHPTNSQTLNFFKSNLPSKEYAFYIIKHSLQQHQEQYVQIKHDNINCQMLTCPSLKRIIDAFKYYKSMSDHKNKNQNVFSELIIKYFETKNKFIVSDFHHILSTHLNQSKLRHLQTLDIIFSAICRHKLHCEMTKDAQFIRHHHHQSNKAAANHKVRFYEDLIDSMHCYFVHASRLKISDLTSMREIISNNDDIKDESSIPFKDENLEKIQKIMSKKKKYFTKIKGTDRMKCNKFKNHSKAGNNCIGLCFYYWDYYKNKCEKDQIYHPNDCFNDWYVSKKYKNIKEEMLSNKLTLNEFDYVTFKASALMKQSDHIQSIKSSVNAIYGIMEDLKISKNMIMALLFFTDYADLRNSFCATFQRMNANETIKECKERNAEFWWLSKTLLECVDCYGSTIYAQKVPVFYTLIDKEAVFGHNKLLFACPISTTPHLELMSIYAQSDDLVLELCPSDYSMKVFDCSFVSKYASEQEMIFFGGRKCIELHSIICLNECVNFRVFIKAFSLFYAAINGQKIEKTKNVNVSNMDYFIIHCLLRHKMKKHKNSFPDYVNNAFCKCCEDVSSVEINLKHLESFYPGLSLIFVSSECDNFVLLDKLTQIFVNCEKMTVVMSEDGNICTKYMQMLIRMMSKINLRKDSNLNQIHFMDVNLRCDENEMKQFSQMLWKKHKWKMIIEERRLSLTKM